MYIHFVYALSSNSTFKENSHVAQLVYHNVFNHFSIENSQNLNIFFFSKVHSYLYIYPIIAIINETD